MIGLTTYVRLKPALDARWAEFTDNSHIQNWENKLRNIYNSCKYENDRCDLTILDRYSSINLNSFSGESKHLRRMEQNIYADGSKTNEGVGAGFVLYKQNKRVHIESIHLPDNSTVFQAEKMAIYEACHFTSKLPRLKGKIFKNLLTLTSGN